VSENNMVLYFEETIIIM